MLALALLVLNRVTVDVAYGFALPDRAVEIQGARIRAVVAAGRHLYPATFRSPRSAWWGL